MLMLAFGYWFFLFSQVYIWYWNLKVKTEEHMFIEKLKMQRLIVVYNCVLMWRIKIWKWYEGFVLHDIHWYKTFHFPKSNLEAIEALLRFQRQLKINPLPLPCSFRIGKAIVAGMVAKLLNRRPGSSTKKRHFKLLFNKHRTSKSLIQWSLVGDSVDLINGEQVKVSYEFFGL